MSKGPVCVGRGRARSIHGISILSACSRPAGIALRPMLMAVAIGMLSLANVVFAGPVGTTVGQFSTDRYGRAGYTIPFDLPGGINGMQPAVGIAYRSGSHDGIAGLGADLYGFSVITRCARTIAQDGHSRAVQYDNDDAFCLDGNRLRLVSGSYGGNGAEYRTEREAFARIRSYSSGASGYTPSTGPKWFQVEGPDGRTYEYGATTDSRVSAAGTSAVRVWALTRVIDRNGNFVRYRYDRDETRGSYRPQSVEWTGTSTASPAHRLRFTYQQRPQSEWVPRFLGGHPIEQRYRLRQAIHEHNGSIVSRYRLNYRSDSGAGGLPSRLASVRQCSSTSCANASSLSPVEFDWQNQVSGWSSKAYVESTHPSGPVHVIDREHDGRAGLLWKGPSGAIFYTGGADGGLGSRESLDITIPDMSTVRSFDYNGNGRQDIVFVGNDGLWKVLESRTGGFDLHSTGHRASSYYFVADIEGNGLDDLVWLEPDGRVRMLRNIGGSFANSVETVYELEVGGEIVPGGLTQTSGYDRRSRRFDLRGDGREGILIGGRRFVTFPCGGEPGCIPQTFVYEFWTVLTPDDNGLRQLAYVEEDEGGLGRVVTADINGDGLSDLVYRRGTSWRIMFSNGRDLESEVDTGVHARTDGADKAVVIDYQGDGRSDIFLPRGETYQILKSTGNGLSGYINTDIAVSSSNMSPIVADFTGSGVEDVVIRHEIRWRIQRHAGQRLSNVKSITDGFGNRISVSYEPLRVSAHYARSEPDSGPNQIMARGLSVVASVSRPDGLGGRYSTRYKYRDARRSAHGRGFLGFASIRKIDERDGSREVVRYRQGFPFSGFPSYRVWIDSSGQKVERENYQYASQTWGSGQRERVLPYLSELHSETFEPSVGGRPVSQTVLSVEDIDQFGNPKRIVESVYGSDWSRGDSQWAAKQRAVTEREYLNDTNTWCLGRPTSETMTVTQDRESQSTSGYREYDSNKCRLSRAGINAVDPQYGDLGIEYELKYDQWGNVRESRTMPAGMETRITTIEHDDYAGYYPASVTNTLGHHQSLGWDPARGQLTSSSGPNGEQVSYDYDEWGRLRELQQPNGNRLEASFNWCAGSCGVSQQGTAGGVYEVIVREVGSAGSDGAAVRTVHDAFSRPIRQVHPVLDGLATTDIRYDVMGLMIAQSVPTKNSEPTDFSTFEYDSIGRITRQNPADGSAPITWSYSALQTTITGKLGQERVIKKDPLGQIRTIEEAGAGVTAYDYTPMGQIRRVSTVDGQDIVAEYDIRGFRRKLNDPDLGLRNYEYDALGQLVSMTDAKGQVSDYDYDELGRLVRREDDDGLATWVYDGPEGEAKSPWIGRLRSMSQRDVGEFRDSYVEWYGYKQSGEMTDIDYEIRGERFRFDLDYNEFGRLRQLLYPDVFTDDRSRLGVNYGYTANGILEEVQNAASGSLYWKAESMDARSNVTRHRLGNGLTTKRDFNPLNGRLEHIATGKTLGGALTDVQDLFYVWGNNGLLEARHDGNRGTTEDFLYDSIGRLDSVQLNGHEVLDMEYNSIGNIKYRSDIGHYKYDSSSPNAVTGIMGSVNRIYEYDANGNMTSGGNRNISWNASNLPTRFSDTQDRSEVHFQYGPMGNRYYRKDVYQEPAETMSMSLTLEPEPLPGDPEPIMPPGGSEVTETLYAGGLFERSTRSDGFRTYRMHVVAGGSVVSTEIRRSNGANATVYLHRDHLGSVTKVTNESGDVIRSTRYDAFGAPVSSGSEHSFLSDIGNRGYTGHEMLADSGLIHMNGRVYDSEIGRFLSADPTIPNPMFSQAYDRYAYVYNSPLNLVDPSGFSPDDGEGGCDPSESRHCKPEDGEDQPVEDPKDLGTIQVGRPGRTPWGGATPQTPGAMFYSTAPNPQKTDDGRLATVSTRIYIHPLPAFEAVGNPRDAAEAPSAIRTGALAAASVFGKLRGLSAGSNNRDNELSLWDKISTHFSENKYGVSFGVSGLLGGGPVPPVPGPFGGGGVSIAITSDLQIIVTTTANLQAGSWAYAGVSGTAGVYYSDQVAPSYSSELGLRAEANFGFGGAAGIASDISSSGVTGVRAVKVGAGFGASLSGGPQRVTSFATPPLLGWGSD